LQQVSRIVRSRTLANRGGDTCPQQGRQVVNICRSKLYYYKILKSYVTKLLFIIDTQYCNGGRANEDWGRKLNESRIYAHTFVRTEGAHLCSRKERICAHGKRAFARTKGAHLCAQKFAFVRTEVRIYAHTFMRTKVRIYAHRSSLLCAQKFANKLNIKGSVWGMRLCMNTELV
jgi:hypothetical protein